MTPDVNEADDILAAELAFGLLEAGEAGAARARADAEPTFAARVDAWEECAAALLDGAGEPPPPSLWARLDARLPGNDDAPDPMVRAARWRAATFATGVLAVLLGALALRPAAHPQAAPPLEAGRIADTPPLVAVLRAREGGAALAVDFDPASSRLTVAADALDARAGSAELWVIPADGTPHSLGLIDTGAPAWRPAPPAAGLIAPGATLAVTIEPRGGSPTGKPSGTPLLTGTVAAAGARGERRG